MRWKDEAYVEERGMEGKGTVRVGLIMEGRLG